MDHFDVVIVGAGMSGIQSAYYLQRDCPGHSYAILEARADLGGTWDLFKYPGVRSDSDMQVYGYSFNRWTGPNQVADGADIKAYLKVTAEKYNINQHIRYNHNVTTIEWKNNSWYITLENQPTITCQFIAICSGYFNYDLPNMPSIGDRNLYTGEVVHPQHWRDIDYEGKDITIIGSGATMVTLAPELAKHANLVTVIQRSPGYIISIPKQHDSSRYKKIWTEFKFWRYCRNNPAASAKLLTRPGYDKPNYYPWDQRVCVTLDNEFFNCVDNGKIELITAVVDSYVSEGIKLTSGQIVRSDIVVTATGHDIKLLGGIKIIVNNINIDVRDTIFYRGAMFTGIPNMATTLGYANQTYTLRCELISRYIVRMIKYMKRKNLHTCTPSILVNDKDSISSELLLQSNYFIRSKEKFPTKTWKLYQNYYKDWVVFKFCNLKKGMKFK
jgi:monooxygenase